MIRIINLDSTNRKSLVADIAEITRANCLPQSNDTAHEISLRLQF